MRTQEINVLGRQRDMGAQITRACYHPATFTVENTGYCIGQGLT